jgi:hypothetical protein
VHLQPQIQSEAGEEHKEYREHRYNIDDSVLEAERAKVSELSEAVKSQLLNVPLQNHKDKCGVEGVGSENDRNRPPPKQAEGEVQTEKNQQNYRDRESEGAFDVIEKCFVLLLFVIDFVAYVIRFPLGEAQKGLNTRDEGGKPHSDLALNHGSLRRLQSFDLREEEFESATVLPIVVEVELEPIEVDHEA